MAHTTLPATVYRLTGITSTVDAMFDATSVDRLAEPGVDVVQIDIAGAPALLYSRQLPTATTGWCASLSQLTGIPLDLNRQDAEAVLFVGVDQHVYGMGFGQGYLSISDAKETGFGLRCALRAIDPLKVGDVVECFETEEVAATL